MQGFLIGTQCFSVQYTLRSSKHPARKVKFEEPKNCALDLQRDLGVAMLRSRPPPPFPSPRPGAILCGVRHQIRLCRQDRQRNTYLPLGLSITLVLRHEIGIGMSA